MYEDKTLVCKECGKEFVFTAGEQEFYAERGFQNENNEKYLKDEQPIDPKCDCPVCRRYSKAYLRHLFKAKEMLAMRLAVMHNLYFYNQLLEKIRESLEKGEYAAFRQQYSAVLDKRI